MPCLGKGRLGHGTASEACGDTCGEVMVCFDHYLQVHVVEETLQCPPQVKCPWCGGIMRDADHCKVGWNHYGKGGGGGGVRSFNIGGIMGSGGLWEVG